MIEQYFPSKRVKPVYQQHHHGFDAHNTSIFNESAKARERGLSIEEYRHRVAICAKAISQCKWKIGDEGYPHTEAAMLEHGKCRVVGLVTHFDQYGDVEWNDPPFIMSVSPTNDTNNTVQCTVGWLVAENPLKEKTHEC